MAVYYLIALQDEEYAPRHTRDWLVEVREVYCLIFADECGMRLDNIRTNVQQSARWAPRMRRWKRGDQLMCASFAWQHVF
jgi:hypothetical protein